MAGITWFGHAAFKIEIANRIVLVDQWLDGNPTSSVKASQIAKADIVYVTHDHGDHLGDALNICKKQMQLSWLTLNWETTQKKMALAMWKA